MPGVGSRHPPCACTPRRIPLACSRTASPRPAALLPFQLSTRSPVPQATWMLPPLGVPPTANRRSPCVRSGPAARGHRPSPPMCLRDETSSSFRRAETLKMLHRATCFPKKCPNRGSGTIEPRLVGQIAGLRVSLEAASRSIAVRVRRALPGLGANPSSGLSSPPASSSFTGKSPSHFMTAGQHHLDGALAPRPTSVSRPGLQGLPTGSRRLQGFAPLASP